MRTAGISIFKVTQDHQYGFGKCHIYFLCFSDRRIVGRRKDFTQTIITPSKPKHSNKKNKIERLIVA